MERVVARPGLNDVDTSQPRSVRTRSIVLKRDVVGVFAKKELLMGEAFLKFGRAHVPRKTGKHDLSWTDAFHFSRKRIGRPNCATVDYDLKTISKLNRTAAAGKAADVRRKHQLARIADADARLR